MTYIVDKSDFSDDWYVLQGGGRTSVEGPLSEWQAVAAGIRAGQNVSFRRVACQKVDGGYRMWSPRNASDRDDYYFVSDTDITALLASIDELEPIESEKAR